MIKIIEKGTKRKIRCRDCGCLFSFNNEDVKNTICGMEIKKPYGIIVCPQCENVIVLECDN